LIVIAVAGLLGFTVGRAERSGDSQPSDPTAASASSPPSSTPSQKADGGASNLALNAPSTVRARVGTGTSVPVPESGLTDVGGFAVDVYSLLDNAEPTVVKISFTTSQPTPFGTQQGTGAASGVIIGSDGLILTNNHVVSGSSEFQVLLADGRTFDADTVGTAPDDDIGLLRLRGASGLKVATLGSSTDTRVGELVFAIGNALDLSGTPSVTHGIISAMERTLSDNQGTTLEHLIQTDAAINSGNSGGPLLNSHGEVVGINTAAITDTENLGFAIAIDRVKPIIAEILERGGVVATKAYLGATTRELSSISQRVRANLGITSTSGVVVVDIAGSGPAEKAGLQVADVVVAIDGEPVTSVADLDARVHAHEAGDRVSIEVERMGTRRRLEIILATRSSD